MFFIFTLLFCKWELWAAIVTTKEGNLIYFIFSILGLLIGLYVGSAYIQHQIHKNKDANEKIN